MSVVNCSIGTVAYFRVSGPLGIGTAVYRLRRGAVVTSKSVWQVIYIERAAIEWVQGQIIARYHMLLASERIYSVVNHYLLLMIRQEIVISNLQSGNIGPPFQSVFFFGSLSYCCFGSNLHVSLLGI